MATDSPKVTFNSSWFKNYSREQTFPLIWEDPSKECVPAGLDCSFIA